MHSRLLRLNTLAFCAFGLLALRLADLQVVQGRYYRDLAEQNRLRVVPQVAPRGLIVDNKGRVLAASHTAFSVAVVPQETPDLAGLFKQLGSLLGRSAENLQRAFQKNKTYPFVPVVVASRISKEAALRLEEERFRLPGLLVQPQAARHYPLGTVAGPLLGYLSEPTANELPKLKPYGVQAKQLIGRNGLEYFLDSDLRGTPGGVVVEVNHRGRQVRTVGWRQSKPGLQVALTLDASLQALLEQSFGAQPGAAVVLNPETGAILAMVSTPSFSPEVFVTQETGKINALLNDAATPLVNRAVANSYQPGSIAKLATAAAGLFSHLTTPQTTVTCVGGTTIGDRTIRCWNRDGHGPLNLSGALMQSCNVYFMQVGRWVRKDRLLAAFEQVGFGQKTGWGYPEQSGRLPKRRLTEGEIALLSIGQGEFLVTPLQAAVYAAVFANEGRVVQPWLIASIGGKPVKRKENARPVSWDQGTLQAVRQGMIETVRHPAGTAHRAYTPSVAIAGKTGTAQTHVAGKTHAWFVGFCPVDHPYAALAILAEHGGSGGDLPTEIARAACEYLAVINEASKNDND